MVVAGTWLGLRSLRTWGTLGAGGWGAGRGWGVVRRMEEALLVATDTLLVATDTLRPESTTERRAVAVPARARL